MTLFQQIDRLEYIHYLIRTGATGDPVMFARRINVSRRQLYNLLDTLKDLGAEVKYSRTQQSFYYVKPFELDFKKKVRQLTTAETEIISGGFDIMLNNEYFLFRAIKLHGGFQTLSS
ncbi:MAG: hypothetical protein LLF81_03790 [Porphyromonadaceae bacterium]|nr:hypothetical protein [Porphyromonadaceae bacterium]